MMRNRLLAIFFSGLLLCCLAGCKGQWINGGQGGGGGQGQGGGGGQGRNHPKATDDEVKASFQKLMDAFKNKDIVALDQMFAANASVIDPPTGGQVLTWTDARPYIAASFKNLGDLQYSFDQAQESVNRDMGWVVARYHVRAATPGSDEAQGGITAVFRKTDEGYRVVIFHAARFSPAPPPGAAAPKAPDAAKPAPAKSK